jgi:hypothetical protein
MPLQETAPFGIEPVRDCRRHILFDLACGNVTARPEAVQIYVERHGPAASVSGLLQQLARKMPQRDALAGAGLAFEQNQR